MPKINLLKQKWVGTVQIKRLKNVARAVVVFTITGFLMQTFYITGRLVYLRYKVNQTEEKIKSLDKAFEDSKDSIISHVWAQGVLEKLEIQKKKEYKYKDYLMEINSWLVEGTSLLGVSFTQEDEISFLVHAKGVDNYRAFETSLNLKQAEEGFGFGVVEQESLSRVEDGSYKVKIKLKI